MAQLLLSNPQVSVNNVSVAIVPNSCKFTEGLGEDVFKTQSAGGIGTVDVFGTNVEKAFSEINFEVEPTQENVDLIKSWKLNNPNNSITISFVENDFTRSFRGAALTTNYEVNLAPDKTITLDFKASQAA